MAIYKSSFNQNNQKPEKNKKERKPKTEKVEKVKKQARFNFKVKAPVVCLIVFSLVFIVCLFPNPIRHLILGLIGLSVYPICAIGITFSAMTLSKKQLRVKRKYLAYLIASVVIVWFIFHLIMTQALGISLSSYGAYLAGTYRAQTTAGGLIFSLISYPIVKLITYVGAYIFCAIALAVIVGLIIDYIYADRAGMIEKKPKFDFKQIEEFDFAPTQEKKNEPEYIKHEAKRKLGLEKDSTTVISTTMPEVKPAPAPTQSRPMSKREYILTPIEPIIPPEETDDLFLDSNTGYYNSKKISRPRAEELKDETKEKNTEIKTDHETQTNQTEQTKYEENSTNSDFILDDDVNDYDDFVELPPSPKKEEYVQSNLNFETNSVSLNYNQNQQTENQTGIQNVHSQNEYSQSGFVNRANYSQQATQSNNQTSQNNQNQISQNLHEQSQGSQLNMQYLGETKENAHNTFEHQVQTESEINSVNNNYAEEIVQNSNIEEDKSEEKNEPTNLNHEVKPIEEINELESLDEDNAPIEHYEEIEETLTDSEQYVDNYSNKEIQLGSTYNNEVVRPSVDISKFNLPNKINKSLEPEQVKIDDIKPKEEIPPYVAPRADLLDYMEKVEGISKEKVRDNVTRLEQVLEDFKVPAKVNNVQVGPAVTRYELSMPRGISVNKIVTMADDIAMTLASNGAIRVEAPIPGKNSVGVEVPNDAVTPVSLRELIDSQEFRVRGNPLSFVLGKDINGDIIFCNLDKMPHLLIAGSTGSGKSVCLNTMLLSLCYKSGPQDIRFILIDPKMVEFSTFNGLPHLLIPEVITGKEMTINAFDWAIKEMERRYALFAKHHVVNINEFNKLDIVKSKREEKLPFIVIVVDELADLMLEAKRELEDRIAKIAAKSRAAGIHLVLATQRPSVDVITGVIKNNLPSRIAFALTSYVDSKTILDGGGAEKLLGKGDMLFKMQDKPEPRRVQGAFVSSAEINLVVDYIKSHNKSVYDNEAGRSIKNPHQANNQSGAVGGAKEQEFDPILKDVLRMFIETKQASSSIIQRRYSVGFNRAGRIMEQMEHAGFVSPPNGSKPRQVLITMEEYKAIFGDDD